MTPVTFNPTSTHPARALQAWQILIGAASNRQTLTYHRLGYIMYGKKAGGVLKQILGHIASWCTERGLPELNSIVVEGGTGTPGYGIPLDASATDAERENVYSANWYDVRPPTEEELRAAYVAALNSN